MTTRSALNLALLGLAAVLAALIYWQPGIAPPAVLPKLTALAQADVRHITIRSQQGTEIRLDKEQGDWMMSAPIATYANGFRIDALLGVAQAESHAQLPVAGLDLAKFHLDTPALLLRLNDVEIAFGDSEPLDNRRYVRVGSTIHLIDDDYYYRLQAGVPAFVSNQLLPPHAKPAQISLPAFSVSHASGQWQLSPAEKQPSMDTLNGFVDEWQRTQAVEVDHYEGGGASRGKITISFEGGAAPLEFLLLQTEPEPVLARADLGLRYHLTAEQAQHLLQPPSSGAAAPAARPE
jgi:hypothetical protein